MTLTKLNKTLNPTQTTIDVRNQPVYALSKELQYRYPHLFEQYCPIMRGGRAPYRAIITWHTWSIT